MIESGSHTAAPAAWRAQVGRRAARAAFALLYAVRSVGGDRVPTTGPIVLAANHIGFLDGALVFALSPRPAHFLVLKQTFTGVLGRVLTFVGQIPLDQQVGDRVALGQALEVLRRAEVVGIFPEGGRGRGDLSTAGRGAAWIALQGHAQVVPVACLGTRRTGELASWWPPLRSRLVVEFGAPITLDLPAGLARRGRVELAGEQIRVALAAHVTAAAQRHGIPLPTDIPPDLVRLD